MNMREIRREHKAAGYHFFDRDTMAHWGSVIASRVYGVPGGGQYFVTSEKDPMDAQAVRRCKVRRYSPDTRRITTVNSDMTQADAQALALAERNRERSARTRQPARASRTAR